MKVYTLVRPLERMHIPQRPGDRCRYFSALSSAAGSAFFAGRADTTMAAASGSALKAVRGLAQADPDIVFSLGAATEAAQCLRDASKELSRSKGAGASAQAKLILRELENHADQAISLLVKLQPGPTRCSLKASPSADGLVDIRVNIAGA